MNATDAPHELNGKAKEKPKRKRSKKGEKFQNGAIRIVAKQEQEHEKCGRPASEVIHDETTYLLKPWIPDGCLTLIAGQPGCGKSSFAAWLIAQAKHAAILPGYEESISTATVPRMRANGVDLSKVLILDDKEYRLPRDKKKLINALVAWGARLLVIDPIDSYMEDDKSENCGPDVRMFLEAAQWLGAELGIAVVGVRHPGKDVKNVMPGSRAWRAVPRSVVVFTMDGSYPPRRFMVHDKDSHGNDALPVKYVLEGKAGQPRKFELQGTADAGLATLGRHVSDPTEKDDVRMAGRILRRLMTKETEPKVQDFKNECTRNGISDRARRQAANLLGLDPKPKEGGGDWFLFRASKDWPSWTDEASK